MIVTSPAAKAALVVGLLYRSWLLLLDWGPRMHNDIAYLLAGVDIAVSIDDVFEVVGAVVHDG